MSTGPGELRVLCVDDNPSLLSLLSKQLRRVDDEMTVDTVEDPTAVPETLASGSYDCVVSDYEMPQQSGLDLLERIRETYPELPFILYTGKGSEAIASEAISAGVTDYLQKDSGSEHYELLANRIREYAHRYRSDRQHALTEQRYRRLVEQSVVGIGLSQDGEFKYTNPRFAEIFGYAPEELVGEAVETVIADEDAARVERAIAQRESGKVDSIHYVVSGEDRAGNEFDVEVSGSRVVYEGAPAVLGVVQRLDARRKALAAMEGDDLADLKMRMEHAAGALASVDGDGALDSARDSVRSALEAVREEPLPDGHRPGVVDLAEQCRGVWRTAAPADWTLTVAGSTPVVAGETAVGSLFRELFEGWDAETDRPLEVTLDANGDRFELTFDPDDDGGPLEQPPDPPVLSRVTELLGWDVLAGTTDVGGVRYTVEGVGAAP